MRKAIVSLLSLITPAAALAQLPPLTAQVGVKIINVDVTVTDSAGHPVTGLTKDDFEIWDDGGPQAVTNFYAIDERVQAPRAAAQKSESPAVPDPFRRKIALLIENNYIEKVQRDAALKAIDRFIDESFDGRYEWAVAVIGNRAEILQSFTSDTAAIHKAPRRAIRPHPYIAAERGYIDEIIEPRFTRRKLITAFAMLRNKRDKNPPRKHGNIPL